MVYEFSNFGTLQDFTSGAGENLSFYEHMHNSFELFVVLEGESRVSIDDVTYTLCKGEAVLIFPNQKHSYSSEMSKHVYWIFSQELIKTFTNQVHLKIPASNKFTPSADTINLLRITSEQDSVLKKKGALYCMLSEFDEKSKYVEKNRINATDIPVNMAK